MRHMEKHGQLRHIWKKRSKTVLQCALHLHSSRFPVLYIFVKNGLPMQDGLQNFPWDVMAEEKWVSKDIPILISSGDF